MASSVSLGLTLSEHFALAFDFREFCFVLLCLDVGSSWLESIYVTGRWRRIGSSPRHSTTGWG